MDKAFLVFEYWSYDKNRTSERRVTWLICRAASPVPRPVPASFEDCRYPYYEYPIPYMRPTSNPGANALKSSAEARAVRAIRKLGCVRTNRGR